jgi:hypothetical protein
LALVRDEHLVSHHHVLAIGVKHNRDTQQQTVL